MHMYHAHVPCTRTRTRTRTCTCTCTCTCTEQLKGEEGLPGKMTELYADVSSLKQQMGELLTIVRRMAPPGAADAEPPDTRASTPLSATAPFGGAGFSAAGILGGPPSAARLESRLAASRLSGLGGLGGSASDVASGRSRSSSGGSSAAAAAGLNAPGGNAPATHPPRRQLATALAGGHLAGAPRPSGAGVNAPRSAGVNAPRSAGVNAPRSPRRPTEEGIVTVDARLVTAPSPREMHSSPRARSVSFGEAVDDGPPKRPAAMAPVMQKVQVEAVLLPRGPPAPPQIVTPEDAARPPPTPSEGREGREAREAREGESALRI